jgi:hypothetical protein
MRPLPVIVLLVARKNALKRNSKNKRWGWGSSVTCDLNENVFITGSFQTDTAVFGNDTLVLGDTTVYHHFITKYDKFGNELWARSAGPESFEYPSGKCITSDLTGNVIVSGNFNGDSISFGGFTLLNSDTNGLSDIFLVKYDSNGNVLWAKKYGGSSADIGQAVATNRQGNIFLTAKFRSDSIAIGNDTLINNGGICFSGNCFNIIIVKHDSSGNVIWSTQPGGSNDGYISGCAMDNSSNLFITGFYQNDLIFGNTTLLSTGIWEYYVAKLEDINTSIEENLLSDIKIFPNPSDGNIQIVSIGKIDELKITNLTGQIIMQVSPPDKIFRLHLNTSGFYLLTLTTVQQTISKKLIVTNQK